MKTISKTIKASLILLLVTVVLAGCKKDDDQVPVPPPVENEGEVITTLKLSFTDPDGIQPSVTATFRDPDGEGGSGPDLFDTIRLAENTTYLVSISLLNETTTPPTDIGSEVHEEGDEHLFCFTPSGVNVAIERTDSDGTYEIGLESKWTTGTTSAGSVKVELKHQPGNKDGSCAPGETDLDVTFITEIQ